MVTGANANPVLSGASEAYALITLFDAGVRIGRVVAGADGAWSWTAPAFAAGSHSLTVTATDAAGNASGLSPAATITDPAGGSGGGAGGSGSSGGGTGGGASSAGGGSGDGGCGAGSLLGVMTLLSTLLMSRVASRR